MKQGFGALWQTFPFIFLREVEASMTSFLSGQICRDHRIGFMQLVDDLLKIEMFLHKKISS